MSDEDQGVEEEVGPDPDHQQLEEQDGADDADESAAQVAPPDYTPKGDDE